MSRIMKGSVPLTAKISKEAKECVQECVSEFISFITSEAAEKCQMEKRKTIGGEDILYAMATLGFENYAETLKIHLAKLRQVRRFVLASCRRFARAHGLLVIAFHAVGWATVCGGMESVLTMIGGILRVASGDARRGTECRRQRRRLTLRREDQIQRVYVDSGRTYLVCIVSSVALCAHHILLLLSEP